jgi:hypothetical protein
VSAAADECPVRRLLPWYVGHAAVGPVVATAATVEPLAGCAVA